MNQVSTRKWSTPITIGSFVVISVTGILLFFHFSIGLNKFAHKWVGLVFVLFAFMHLISNFNSFINHMKKPYSALIIYLGVLVLVLSFFQFPMINNPSTWVIVERLKNVPLKEVIYLSGKTEGKLKEILNANHVHREDINNKTAVSVFNGDNKKAVILLIEILK